MNTFLELARTKLKLLLGKGYYQAYGQNGEDAFIHALFRGVKNGTYVDVGSYHPILYSNTYGFYRKGWKGLTIDPNPTLRPLHRALRPRDTFVLAGIAEEEREADYYFFNDGAYNTFDPNIAEQLKQRKYPRFLGQMKAQLMPLRTILKAHGITKVDYLDIDVEGLDLAVLESLDWSMPPTVISVERLSFQEEGMTDDPAYRYLHERGYILIGFFKYTLVFIRRESYPRR